MKKRITIFVLVSIAIIAAAVLLVFGTKTGDLNIWADEIESSVRNATGVGR